MTLATLVIAVAMAGPARSPEELSAQGARAESLIARCQEVGRACGATEAELGEAFVVRAVSAAVVEGRVDATASANARALAPEMVSEWAALLSEGGAPEAWVLSWQDRAESASAPPVEPTPSPRRGATRGELRAGASYSAVGNREIRSGVLQARFPVSGRLSVLAEGAHLRRSSNFEGLPVDAGLPDEMVFFEERARLGVGPRWTGDGGAELHVVAAAAGSMEHLARATREALEAMNTPAAEREYGGPSFAGGGALGAVGVHPFVRGGALAVRWEGWTQVVTTRIPGRELGPDGALVETGDTMPMTTLSFVVEPGLRWQPGEGGLVLGMSGTFEVDRVYLRGVNGRRGQSGARATVGWVL